MITNYDAVKDQLLAAGLRVNHLQAGKLMRVPCEGDSGKQKTGWYILHELNTGSGDLLLTGAFGDWRGGGKHTVSLKGHTISAEEKAVLRKKVAEDKKRADAKRKGDHRRAAARAEQAWQKCEPCGVHDLPQYLVDKGVQAHGLKVSPKGALMIPMHDVDGQISGLQVIHGDPETIKKKGRNKDFWPTGLEKKGRFFQIGTPTWVVLIAEGYATGASLFEATGLPVVIAFDAGNLAPVAEAIHKRYRDVKILICGDDDFKTKDNPGVAKASMAALVCNGKWVVPVFNNRGDKKLTDFNDLHQAEGLTPVRTQIEKVLHDAGWSATATEAVGVLQGGGEGGFVSPKLSINQANEIYTEVYGVKDMFFDHQRRKLVPAKSALNRLPDHAWREWRMWDTRRIVDIDNIGFDPTNNDENVLCNLWGGWPTKPQQGDCTKLLGLLEYLCSSESRDNKMYDWVLKWLAYPVQHPGAKIESALIFHGGQGTGKNLFFEAYKAIFGEYGSVVDQGAMEDKFNDFLSKKLLLIADEVVARNELYHQKNKLKMMITGDTHRINPKNVASHTERNHINVVFLSNEVQPMVLEGDDRRHAVVKTPFPKSKDYYREVYKEIQEGGVAALHDHLLNLELGSFNTKSEPPMTKSKQDVIDLSMDSIDQFMSDWKDGDLDLPVVPAMSEDIYPVYVKYCRKNGIIKPMRKNRFLGQFNMRRGWVKERGRFYANLKFNGEAKQKMVVYPPSALLEKVDQQGPNEMASQWLTRCIVKFRQACIENEQYE